ncbi:MAG: tripeptide aminopeptidase PepT, partial [Bacteroidales bacterium]|nr:tripeptide aminopeptidase PepT [Bacteroidales bacterium]
MEKLLDRFLRYVAIDTQSNEESESQPSEAKELDLLRLLRDELNEMGVQATLDEYGYVMGSIPSNIDAPVPAIGFIAHVDTAPDASGKGVKPQIIRQYDGGDIALKGVPGLYLKPSEFPELLHFKGQTIITTDGTTLLGADDKAGVAEIMDAVQYIMAHPEFRHGEIKIAFTPDEEIGRGVVKFDVQKFGAEYAYTM